MECSCATIDAFTNERFKGNPTAVVFDAAEIPESHLIPIAREFNLTRTVFVLPPTSPGAAVRFRTFTPEMEDLFGGHGLLAGVHGLVEQGRFLALRNDPEMLLPIQTHAGIFTVRMEKHPQDDQARILWLDMPRPELKPEHLNFDRIAELINCPSQEMDESLPLMRTQDDDVIAFVNSFQTLFQLAPDHQKLAWFCERKNIRGLCIATIETPSPSIMVQSRYFAPRAGVPEDPVNGGVHGPLATYLVINELVPMARNTAAVACVQAESGGRAGLVRAMVTQQPGEGFSVRLAGQCMTTMKGTLLL